MPEMISKVFGLEIVRKAFRVNHKIVEQAVPSLYVVGVVFVMIFGAQVLRGAWTLEIDVGKLPTVVGYVCLWGGFILFVCFLLEVGWQNWLEYKRRVRRKRIREAKGYTTE